MTIYYIQPPGNGPESKVTSFPKVYIFSLLALGLSSLSLTYFLKGLPNDSR